jgi:hypothetical protein
MSMLTGCTAMGLGSTEAESDYVVFLAMYGQRDSLEAREFQVGDQILSESMLAPGPSERLGEDIWVVAGDFAFCTPSQTTFFEAPLHVTVHEDGVVLSDQWIERPGCRYSETPAAAEDVSLFVESDGTVRTDFGVHPLVQSQCGDTWPHDCQENPTLPMP